MRENYRKSRECQASAVPRMLNGSNCRKASAAGTAIPILCGRKDRASRCPAAAIAREEARDPFDIAAHYASPWNSKKTLFPIECRTIGSYNKIM